MTVRKYSKTTFSLVIIIVGLLLLGKLLIENQLSETTIIMFDYQKIGLSRISSYHSFIIKSTALIILVSGVIDAIISNKVGLKIIGSMIVPLVMCFPLVIMTMLTFNGIVFWLFVYIDYIIALFWTIYIVTKNCFKNRKTVFGVIKNIKNGPDNQSVNLIDRYVSFILSIVCSIWLLVLVIFVAVFVANIDKEALLLGHFDNTVLIDNEPDYYPVAEEEPEEIDEEVEEEAIDIVEYDNDSDAPDLSKYKCLKYSDLKKCDVSSIISERHKAKLIFDGDISTNWQEGVDGPGIGESVEVELKNENKIVALSFYLGSWVSKKKYYENNRPSEITLRLNDNEYLVEFSDEKKRHDLYLTEPASITNFGLTIDNVYPGEKYDDTVISEIEIHYSK